ncbi:CAZyme family AA3 [Penicillium odoratum]|uniref:CAZyme family AA3 n=1 Tax=Penicillium odoratum TaxID=1167516 RepID=UPI0025471D9B|nr:CAZyme family AA3 [Penicillium odoratum]KAJ5745833.1 CAZyme family AA3 [Penicillium odoratum]
MGSFDTEASDGLENATYDFVIVGGGTAGLVVANRLTENPNIRVLVLEAGTNRLNDPRINIPGLGPATFEDDNFDWNFRSIPQEQLNGRKLLANKGRTLGGSSAINLGMVIYPSRSGLDAWEALGNPGWGWDGLAPYIRKFHTASPPSSENRLFFKGMKYDQHDQGNEGPVQVSFGDQYMPYHSAWMDTFKTLGYPQVEDPINGAGTGPFVSPGAVDPITHTRSHSAAAYLTLEVQARPNLRVVTGALVEKLLLEKRENEVVATSVRFTKNSHVYTVSVEKEVILAAGTTQSSQILELSGIGDEKILQSHGIPTVINNPGVGENLQDHGIVSFGYEVADGMPSGDMARDPAIAAAAMAAYQKDGSGPLGMLLPREEEPKRLFGLGHPGFFISIVSLLSHPLSRGSVHIQSSDPKAAPMIDHGTLRNSVDLELHARHSMWMDKIAEAEPLASLLKKGGERLHTPEPLTDVEKAKELCKELVLSMYHVSGTCVMMPREDGGVVDSHLKVYGSANIRVVDASIFPLEPRGNIQATVFAVAEKAADIIKQGLKSSS